MLLKNLDFQVILVSGLILFLELFLIRFLPSQILYFGYFTNFVLIASFLGIGIGFLLAEHKANLINYFPITLLILFVCSWIFGTGLFLEDNDLIFFRDAADFQPVAIPSGILLPVFFMLVSAVFVTLAQFLAKLFVASEKPLRTYIFDILGSILGIVIFFGISSLGLPPAVWLIIVVVIFFILSLATLAQFPYFLIIFALCFLLTFKFNEGQTFWSPYYKINLLKQETTKGGLILANNIHHQQFSNYEHSSLHNNLLTILSSQSSLEDVLIIGSGSGQDVAAALRMGAKRIDAVEIDPLIYKIGKIYHPEKPYQDPRVSAIINDGRNFLKNSGKKYDLIIFALTDSLVLNSGIGEVRLESYLFTQESFNEAHQHLKDKGIFVLYNDYRKDWLINRFDQMLKAEFSGQVKQISLYGLSGSDTVKMFIAYNGASCSGEKAIDSRLPHDDWPFLYLKEHKIPFFYIGNLTLILLISLISIYLVINQTRSNKKFNISRLATFFLLGAAFSLIETKSIVQLSLLFGSTWQVNVFSFIGILVTVLLAALLTLKTTKDLKLPVFILLITSLIAQYFIPTNQLLVPNFSLKVLLSLIYFFTPVFLANLIFADLFKRTKKANIDFAFNILGLVFGGVLEYLALIYGYTGLAWVVIIFYSFSFIFLPLNYLEDDLSWPTIR